MTQDQQLEGVLPIWKPKGWTSHDVVAKARRILRMKRIGHTGTLDPEVTGVLPLCLGRATRLVEYIQDLPKQYEAQLVLGLATDTEDLSGTVLERADDVRAVVTEEEVRQAIRRFEGEIEQVPPMYSAVKVDGKRLYELARQGLEVERKPRKVTVHSIELLGSDWSRPHPTVRFRVLCSKGTYIRTLCVDMGRALGVPAAMAELVRTSTGGIGRDQCLTLEEAESLYARGELSGKLLSADRVLRHLPEVELSPEQKVMALQGRKLRVAAVRPPRDPAPASSASGESGEVAAFDEQGQLVGIFLWEPEQRMLTPRKIFSSV